MKKDNLDEIFKHWGYGGEPLNTLVSAKGNTLTLKKLEKLYKKIKKLNPLKHK